MKIAQPLGWEKLCSDNQIDSSFLQSKRASIQQCEQRFNDVSDFGNNRLDLISKTKTKNITKREKIMREEILKTNRSEGEKFDR